MRRLGPTVTVPLLDYQLVLQIERSTHDFLVFEAMASDGYYERSTTLLLMKELRTGQVFIDVGANNGYYTLLASSRVGPTGRVIALEPNPDSFDRLMKNLSFNRITNVTSFDCGAGDSEGSTPLYIHPFEDGRSSSFIRSTRQVLMRTVPLDGLAEARDADVVKIDVEGGEAAVLRGMAGLINSRHRPKFVVEWNRELGQTGDLWEVLMRYNFSVYEIRLASGGDAAELRPILKPEELPDICNLWCVKPDT